MGNILGLVAADVAERMNLLEEEGLFRLGDDAVPETAVAAALAQNVDLVVSSSPEAYRRVYRRVEGERVVTVQDLVTTEFWLFGGPPDEETGRGLPAGATVANVALYHNYQGSGARVGGEAGFGGGVAGWGTSGRRFYGDRLPSDRLAAGRFSVDDETGQVTLAGWSLAEGDTIHADYDHTATAFCAVLRKVALDLTVVQIKGDLPYAAQKFAELESDGRAGRAQLMALMEGVVGLDMFDQLRLVEETRTASRLGLLPRTGGW